MPQLTEKGRLQYGIEFGGKWHYDFEVRVPTVKDNIEAVEYLTAIKLLSGIRVSFAMMVSSIVSLGDIPKDKITFELLSEGLADTDFDAIDQALHRVKKKREELQPDLKAIMQDDSSLDDTV